VKAGRVARKIITLTKIWLLRELGVEIRRGGVVRFWKEKILQFSQKVKSVLSMHILVVTLAAQTRSQVAHTD
jgi:hypothetical protein